MLRPGSARGIRRGLPREDSLQAMKWEWKGRRGSGRGGGEVEEEEAKVEGEEEKEGEKEGVAHVRKGSQQRVGG